MTTSDSSPNRWSWRGSLSCLDVEADGRRAWTFFWPGRVVVDPRSDGVVWAPNGARQPVPLGTALVAPPCAGQLRIEARAGASFRVLFEDAAATTSSPRGRVYLPQIWASPEPLLQPEALFAGAVQHLEGATSVSLRVPPIVSRARDVLERSLLTTIDLEALARVVGVDRCHLCRTFQRYLGLPPYRFRAQLRIAHARSLLERGMECSEVAHAVGFFDQSHLTRSFKDLAGTTPGAYARACRPPRGPVRRPTLPVAA